MTKTEWINYIREANGLPAAVNTVVHEWPITWLDAPTNYTDKYDPDPYADAEWCGGVTCE